VGADETGGEGQPGVTASDHGDELVHGVLVARQQAGPGGPVGEPPLYGLARLPVLAVGDVPEVDGEGRVEAGAVEILGGERPAAPDPRTVGGEGCDQVVPSREIVAAPSRSSCQPPTQAPARGWT